MHFTTKKVFLTIYYVKLFKLTNLKGLKKGKSLFFKKIFPFL